MNIAASTQTTISGIESRGSVASTGLPSLPPPVRDAAESLWHPARAALYVRVSTADQTVEQQIEVLTRYCAARAYEVKQLYADVGVSGWKGDREPPELARFFKEASKTQPCPYDVLVFVRLDRFSRRGIRATLNELQQLETLGIRWESATEPIFNGTNRVVRELMLALLAVFAQWESEVRSERVKERVAAVRSGTLKGSIGGRPVRLTATKLAQIADLKKRGKVSKDIAQLVQLPKGTIRYALWKLRKEGKL